MATPRSHAVVTASSFERWSHCTAAPRYEEQFPDKGGTVYSAAGTLAHSVCELYGRKKFTAMSTRKFNAELKKLKQDELWQDEMIDTAEFYVGFLTEKAMASKAMPHVFFEIRVDLSDYIPEGFGTCDCAMVCDDLLRITDYKHGVGVPVSSIGNGQMRLYALGALKQLYPIFGDTIKRVATAIVQPRITENVVEEYLSVDYLKAWGEGIKPKAQAAFDGTGSFCAGEWCRFCKGKAECRARAEYYAGFSQYLNADVEGRMSVDEKAARKTAEDMGQALPLMLSDAEIGALLVQAGGLSAWYADLQDYARQAILAGRQIPGWKVVEGKLGDRKFTDAGTALDRMRNEGYDDAVLYDRKPLTLTQLEKLTGKTRFAELMTGLITRAPGKPNLASADDPRPEYHPAAGPDEFTGVTNG